MNSREGLKARGRRPNSRSNIDLIESRKKFSSYDLDELIARTGHQEEENEKKRKLSNEKDNLYQQ